MRQGTTYLPGWDDAEDRRLMLIERFMPFEASTTTGHTVGVDFLGRFVCTWYGEFRAARGAE